jgi:hypothetical protein
VWPLNRDPAGAAAFRVCLSTLTRGADLPRPCSGGVVTSQVESSRPASAHNRSQTPPAILPEVPSFHRTYDQYTRNSVLNDIEDRLPSLSLID